MIISGLLEQRAQEFGDRTFIQCEDETYSYAQVQRDAGRVAANLAARGVGKGDKIVLLMGNCLEFLYVFLGAGSIGAVTVPVNPMLKPDEIAFIVNDSDAQTLITIPEFAPLLPQVRSVLPAIQHVFVLGEATEDAESFLALLASPPNVLRNPAEPGDDAALIYTSGTTGMPKGVVLTHRNYIWNARMMVRAIDMTAADRFFCILPLFHVNAQVITILSPLLAGGDVVLMKKFAPFSILPMIEKYRATILSAVPTIYNVISRMPRAETYDVSSIRFFVSGGAPLSEDTFNEVTRVLKRPFISGYGLSEATCGSAAGDYRDPVKWSSVGAPLRYTGVRIVGDDGADVPYGDVGEILISGPAVMKGYYKNPEATREALRGGWLYTGDLGRFDEDGYLYIVGRKKDMIIRGGQNIYPQQIENVLAHLPEVEECCVVGIEEARWGQEVLAVVKLVEGKTATEEAIVAYCREHLASYKCPKYVRFVESLPKTATGKIRKPVVAAQFAHITVT
ncbi:MAG: long-chain-fatty-acid--CoA ligase [Candidatus Hydrogenedentes bacterium]|nr:long-chain-fatty-acid--CoA ligase [Candidatus Hydrogenedentota bacterium]